LHRNASTAAFSGLPALGEGKVAHVDAAGVRYTYRAAGNWWATRTTTPSSALTRSAFWSTPGRFLREAGC